MGDFFESEPGQILAGAHRYLTAAELLRSSDTWAKRSTLLQTPVLHLLGHGIELLLKFALFADGMNATDVKRGFGHKLIELWSHDLNLHIRELAMESASMAWAQARSSGAWPQDDFEKDPRDELVRALHRLAWLHSSESDFALRYVVPPATTAPRPAFLIEVFGDVAERGVKNPRILIEKW